MKKTIIVIVGHTGAGKSFLVKRMQEKHHFAIVCLSDLGIILPKAHLLTRHKIEKLMLKRIESILKNRELIVVDGLASFRLYNKLKKRYIVKTVFLNTPYRIRIERIATRERISYAQAEYLEQQIESHKNVAGLKRIIIYSDFIISDTTNNDSELIREWISAHEK